MKYNLKGHRAVFSRTMVMRIALYLLLVCIFFLPFLNQAFHIDDPNFIAMSKQVGWNPLTVKQVASDEYVLGKPDDGKSAVYLPYESTHTILISYYIKIIRTLWGEVEATLHLSFLIFPLITLAALAGLYGIFARERMAASKHAVLFFVSMPAFLVPSHTVMSDVPTLAFLLAAVYTYAASFNKDSRALPYAGGLLLTLAVFASYQMIFFVPLLFLYAILERKLNRHVVMSLSAPALILLSWFFIIYALYDFFPLRVEDFAGHGVGMAAEVKRGLLSEVFQGKVINIFALLGASLFFVLLASHVLKKSVRAFSAKIAFGAAICFIALHAMIDYSAVDGALLSVLVSMGMLSLIDVTVIGLQQAKLGFGPRAYFLLAWTYTVIIYNIILLPFGAARYLLPALPPMMIMLFNGTQWETAGKKRRSAVTVVLLIALAFGWAAAYSDYLYANTYRDFAVEVKQFRSSKGDAFTVWFIGQWGMKHYMEREGCRLLPQESNEPKKGDFVIIPEMPRFWRPSVNVIHRLKPYATREYHSKIPLRLFNRRSNAGFYAHHWGLLPFSFSHEPLEVFHILEVVS